MHTTVHVFLLLFAVVRTTNGIQAQATNTSNIPEIPAMNWRQVLSDRNFVTRHINCVLGKAPCDKLGGQLKSAIPEVLQRNCARCTRDQVTKVRKLMNFMKNRHPSDYMEVLKKFGRVTRKRQGSAPARPTIPRSANGTKAAVPVQQLQISPVQSPTSKIEATQQAESSSASLPKGVILESARREIPPVQSPTSKIETAHQTGSSSVNLPKGVVLERPRPAKYKSPSFT